MIFTKGFARQNGEPPPQEQVGPSVAVTEWRRIDMTRTATLWVLAASVSLSAQITPAPTPSVSVTGCVAQVQRDGSMGAKGTGTTSTPETAPVDANSPDQTGRYQLLDATPVAADGKPADMPADAKSSKPARTTYSLRGQEKELARHLGHRVQIAGSLMPPLENKLPPQSAETAEGIRTVQVSSVKMLGTDCSATKGK
jgi:hypothetical protein